jgi:tRNA G10  N-methylase Trm11
MNANDLTPAAFDQAQTVQLDLPGVPVASVAKARRVAKDAQQPGSARARAELLARYRDKLKVNPALTRQLVSFQANKAAPFYRWFKYKEAFSANFVDYVLRMFARPARNGGGYTRVLDPFAGAGTTLSVAASSGWRAAGIELLAPGVAAVRAREASARVSADVFVRAVESFAKLDLNRNVAARHRFAHVRITEGAFAPKSETQIAATNAHIETIADADIAALFRFAAMSALEDASFTRKDGQYLRWDHRAPRALQSSFDKGAIHDFRDTMLARLNAMVEDLAQRAANGESPSADGTLELHQGSCLDLMPTLRASHVDLILTSPPYCNRYDYTRTYALELAFLGCGERDISELRQTLLSATVENRAKRDALRAAYDARRKAAFFRRIESTFENQAALHEILAALHAARERKELNNPNIPGMIANYFFEMNVLIHEMARVLKRGGRVVMVNDNVQYHGEEVPVDLILSDFAAGVGLETEAIWVLDRGKGNSSQQMGTHGRNEIRKCVYVWRKP